MKNFYLAILLSSTLLGTNLNLKAAETEMQKLETKAKAGDTEAQYQLGNKYMHGTGVPQDYLQASEWLRKAVKEDHPKAQLCLGWLY